MPVPAVSQTADLDRPEPPVAEMSVDEALRVALRMHQAGERETAMDVYRRILALVPEHADALHFLAIGHHQQHEHGPALDCIERALALAPEHADMHLNHGNMLLERGRFDAAAAAYRRAGELGNAQADLYNNLGVLHRASGRPAQAEQAYLRALEIASDHPDLHNNLANLYIGQGRIEEGIRQASMALALRPQDAKSRHLLAMAYGALGRHDDAAALYRRWMEDDPDDPLPRHYLGAFGGEVPPRASDAYVVAEFDSFANSFDAKLESLVYRAPQLLGDLLAERWGAPAQALDVLDAGCGTGLCGPFLTPYARVLHGVDLSEGMLAKARARGGYDMLGQAELTAFLQEHPATYDLVLSADTLCYFGPLEAVVAAAAGALRDGGQLLFTVEASPDADTRPCTLLPHGRYSHRQDHVRQALQAAGLSRARVDAVHLRMEGGKPVEGWAVAAQRLPRAAATASEVRP